MFPKLQVTDSYFSVMKIQICGNPDISIAELKRHSRYENNLSEYSAVICYAWEVGPRCRSCRRTERN